MRMIARPKGILKLAALLAFAPAAWAQLTVTAPCPAPTAAVNQPYFFQITYTGAVGSVSFVPSGLPPGMDINGTGTILGSPSQGGVYPITVLLTDSAGHTATYSCNIVVNGPVTITAPCPAPTGTLGVFYSFTISATGQGLVWDLGSTILPQGLSFNSQTGVISGTPTQTGTFPISVNVIDQSDNVAVYTCQIVINPLTITAPCPAPGGMVGVPYSFAITAAGPGPFSWNLLTGSFPPGLSINSSTGVISGIPTAAGNYPFSVRVSPIGFASFSGATYTCSITISPQSLSITTACPITALPVSLTATGGTGNYSFSITGSLPPGMSFNGRTLTGSLPTDAGTYPFTIVVNDGQQTAQKPCSVVVNPPPLQIISGCPGSSFAQGSPMSFTLTAINGTDYVWSIIGNLPAGLRLSGNVISGTPTAAPGKYDFTVQVTSGSATASAPCSIVITDPQLHFTTSCPGNGNVGTPYGPFVLAATGGSGAGTYKYAVSGNLPSGVSLSVDTIAGIPDTAGTYLFTLYVSSGRQTVSLPPCSVAIAPPSLSITGSCPGSPVPAGTPVSIPLTVAGGKGPYKYTLSGPSWLAVNTSGANPVLFGTPAPGDRGDSAILVTVTDSNQATATFRCSISVTSAPLQIGGACPANRIAAGATLSIPVTATGGVPPYKWALAGDSGLSLSSDQGSATNIAGSAPSSPGSYSFTLTLNDSANSTPATLACPLNVQLPPLQITGSCPPSTLDLPLTLAIPLAASGGKAPYTWKLSGPAWIGLSSATGTSVTVASTATPDAPGPFSLSVTLSDSANSTPATLACNSSINSPQAPAVTISGFTSTASLLQPVSGGLRVSAPPLLPLTGVVQLSFIPNAFGLSDNPQVVFAGGGRTAQFSIAPGQSSFSLPDVQQGTVAGTIHLEIVTLKQGNVDVLTTPHPSVDLVIPRLPPTLQATDVTFANETATGFDVVISGFSTPRDVKSVVLTFAASNGASLNGTTSFTVDVSSLFTQYYSSTASQLVGSMFQNLVVPVSINGDKTAIGSVTVTVVNSAGNSAPITKSRP